MGDLLPSQEGLDQAEVKEWGEWVPDICDAIDGGYLDGDLRTIVRHAMERAKKIGKAEPPKGKSKTDAPRRKKPSEEERMEQARRNSEAIRGTTRRGGASGQYKPTFEWNGARYRKSDVLGHTFTGTERMVRFGGLAKKLIDVECKVGGIGDKKVKIDFHDKEKDKDDVYFAPLRILDIIMTNITATATFECGECGAGFTTKRGRDVHVEQVH
jgi:hypothetical protein